MDFSTLFQTDLRPSGYASAAHPALAVRPVVCHSAFLTLCINACPTSSHLMTVGLHLTGRNDSPYLLSRLLKMGIALRLNPKALLFRKAVLCQERSSSCWKVTECVPALYLPVSVFTLCELCVYNSWIPGAIFYEFFFLKKDNY